MITDKININTSGIEFSAIKKTDVGNNPFSLEHDWVSNIEINTAADKSGANVGFEYLDTNDYLASKVGSTVAHSIRVTDPTYQTGDIYIFGKYVADTIDAYDINDLNHFTNYLNTIQKGKGFRHGILIPLYIYPSFNADDDGDSVSNQQDDDWWFNQFLLIRKNYPTVPTLAVINPSSGPGNVVDGNYTLAIKRLKGGDVVPVGYVATTYAGKSVDDVKKEIDTWLDFYPDIEGIFFDEMTNDNNQSHFDYYQEITNYAHTKRLFSIGNPGSIPVKQYFDLNCADIIITHENSVPPTEDEARGTYYTDSLRDVKISRRAALVYSQISLPSREVLQRMRKYYGYIYITDGSGSSPWGVVSSYLEDIYKLVDVSSNIPAVDVYDLSSGNITHTFPPIAMKGQVCDVFWTNGGTYTLSFAVSNAETIGGETASVWKGEGEGHIRVISDGTNWQVVEYDDYRDLGNGKWWEKRRDGMIVLYTWDYVQGDGASLTIYKDVPFSGLFPYNSILTVEGELLGSSSSNPTNRKSFSSGTSETRKARIGWKPSDTTQYRYVVRSLDGTNLTNGLYYGGNIRIYGKWK